MRSSLRMHGSPFEFGAARRIVKFRAAGLSISSIGICWDPLQILMVLQGASLYHWEIAATTLDSCLRVALSVNKR